MYSGKEKDIYLLMLKNNPDDHVIRKQAHIGKELIDLGYAIDASSKDGFYCMLSREGEAFINAGGFKGIAKEEFRKDNRKSFRRIVEYAVTWLVGFGLGWLVKSLLC